MAAHAPELADLVRERGTVLPGAAEAIAALAMAGADGADAAASAAGGEHGARQVVQALLTGNIRPLAEVKLGALGLTGHLDLDVGAYGDVHELRSQLVEPARRKAALAYGADFGGHATILVGDTPLDVEAALVAGARAVGVATGGFSGARRAARPDRHRARPRRGTRPAPAVAPATPLP
jgi:phosphoglycolate phosphatase-like HAD superfamily hydrolase